MNGEIKQGMLRHSKQTGHRWTPTANKTHLIWMDYCWYHSLDSFGKKVKQRGWNWKEKCLNTVNLIPAQATTVVPCAQLNLLKPTDDAPGYLPNSGKREFIYWGVWLQLLLFPSYCLLRTELKYRKLKKYLEEICERQKKSLLRNRDLLKEFDCIEAHIWKFASKSECLQKLKAEYERETKSRQILERKNISKSDERDDIKCQMMPEARQAGINTRTAMSRGLYRTATIFMGRQMSAVSSVEEFSALQKSSELTKSFSISDPYSRRQPSQSSYVTDSCVVRTNSNLQRSNKSDKIDEKTYLLMGEEMPVTSSVSYENGITCGLTVESKTNNCSSNFVESKMSPELNSLLHGRLSPENRTTDLKSDSSCKSLEEILTHEHSVQNEQGSKRPILLVCHPEQLVSGNEQSRAKFPVLEDCLPLDENAQEEEGESLDRSSDLTVTLSEEEEEMNPLKLQQSLEDIGSNTIYNEKEHPLSQTLCHISSGGSSVSLAIRKSLSCEGFAHVLTFIEHFVATADPVCLTLYQSKAVNAMELETVISICNERGSLKQEDLEVCEALVLHQLQRFLQLTMNGCLFPEKMLNDERGTLDEKQVRPELTSYFAMAWKRLSEHILFLQKHHVLLRQEVKDMFDTLLIFERHEQGDLATPLLKESFPEKHEDRSLACSDKTSYNLQTNSSSVKRDKYVQWLGNNVERGKEVASWCEDESKEESLVEKIPITGLNIDGNSLKEQKSNGTSSEPSFSSLERRSPLSRAENQRGMVSTIKSKAFWGDSDDSNSDIEAALRPQEHCSQKDEFDDFYD
ncbi:centrosomal protein kizuna isoform X2 [Rhineura floridana]|uniref:centrosomal protein kizuna isoform X2 n=1 Tax=Rhineura floridana TaxID=261503 RepID=UPI002AC85FD5|nr:centrosomal protein kizuna isoform X2 [Rhineura floridana]